MDYQPHHPGKPALHLYLTEFRNGTVTSHCRHRAQITVMERFHLLPFLKSYQVLCQQFALLDSNLRQLGVSVRIAFVARQNALVTDSKHIIHSFYTIEPVNLDTSAAPYQRSIQISDSYSGDTAHPNKGTRSNLRSVFEYDFMVAVIYDAFIQEYIHAHFAKKLFGMCR